MDHSKEVFLNIPHCPVNYKICLDELDLALLPMSWLLDSRESFMPPLSTPRSKSSNLNSNLGLRFDEVLDFQYIGKINGISDCSPVEFEATAERQEQYCTNDIKYVRKLNGISECGPVDSEATAERQDCANDTKLKQGKFLFHFNYQ